MSDDKQTDKRQSDDIYQETRSEAGGVPIQEDRMADPHRVDVAQAEDVPDDVMRRHYSAFYAGRGYTYEHYQPAYYFGYQIANAADFKRKLWPEVEDTIRQRWNNENDNTWDHFKEAVKHGWNMGVNELVSAGS